MHITVTTSTIKIGNFSIISKQVLFTLSCNVSFHSLWPLSQVDNLGADSHPTAEKGKGKAPRFHLCPGRGISFKSTDSGAMLPGVCQGSDPGVAT